jgi:quinol monooxygenase YgiN
MAFIRIIEFRTSDIDGVRLVHEDWRSASEGRRTVRREILARDPSDPNRYFAVEFFDSYESAMENSELPESAAAVEQYMKATDGPPVFYDLEVLGDRT